VFSGRHGSRCTLHVDVWPRPRGDYDLAQDYLATIGRKVRQRHRLYALKLSLQALVPAGVPEQAQNCATAFLNHYWRS